MGNVRRTEKGLHSSISSWFILGLVAFIVSACATPSAEPRGNQETRVALTTNYTITFKHFSPIKMTSLIRSLSDLDTYVSHDVLKSMSSYRIYSYETTSNLAALEQDISGIASSHGFDIDRDLLIFARGSVITIERL